jgi:hypothetical protein
MNTAPFTVSIVAPSTPAVSDELAKRGADILAALATLHTLTINLNGAEGKPLPPFAQCGEKEHRASVDRACFVLRTIEAANRKAREDAEKARLAAVRASIQGVIDTYMVAAQGEKAEYDRLSPGLQAKMGPFPSKVRVPLSDLVGCFPQGTPAAQIVSGVKALSYTVGSTGTAFFLEVPFTPTASEAPVLAAVG